MKVYADNAAMKPLLPEVKQVIRDFLDADIRNPSAIYSVGRITKVLIESARHTVAKAIGADPDEIYFTSGASESINWFAHDAAPIYTTTIEHKAVLRNANYFIPVDETGIVDLDVFRQECPHYGYVVVGWVNNEIVTIQPIKEIIDICHKRHSCILVDATQALGHISVNVHELGMDCMVGSFGKLGGLSGSGFMYIKHGTHIEPLIKGGGQERGMRASTENVLGIIAGAQAIEIATAHIAPNTIRRDYIIENLLQIPKSHLNGSWVRRVDNNINIAFEGIEAESLVLQCDMCGLQISSGSACNSASIEPSHVLKAIGLSDDLARASIRITIGDDITDEEVEFIIKTVTDCVAKLRSMSPVWKEIENERN